MFTRMLQYATFITTFYEFDIKLLQVYYYTGDGTLNSSASGSIASSGNYAVQNHFAFVDAGAHDAWEMLESGNPYFAILGLLSREIREFDRYLQRLLALGEAHFDTGDLREWLVACTAVACLRDRHQAILRKLKPIMQNQVLNDPIIRTFGAAGRSEGRALARDFYDRTQSLKASLRPRRVPRAFLDWIMLNASEEDMVAMENAIAPGMTFDELVEESRIDWAPRRKHGL
ncbi:hypothetical protein ASE04_28975 [Rhizobium sp. Root708]|uniref:hypothetical protein n=1 Tax=Rhizobium sp. Root708 TaxID=1736592 RepID=UPI0006F2370B|nr:hypothetical protein [Rhizobium sp. Root708]KRB56187.1 hypothetical protein ASE04_28975 [Rhizobium sp. Root708]